MPALTLRDASLESRLRASSALTLRGSDPASNISDSLGITDSITRALTRVLSDSLGITMAVGVPRLIDALGLTDNLYTGAVVNAAQTWVLRDTTPGAANALRSGAILRASVNTLNPTLNDALGLTDTRSTSGTSTALNKVLSDSLGILDAGITTAGSGDLVSLTDALAYSLVVVPVPVPGDPGSGGGTTGNFKFKLPYRNITDSVRKAKNVNELVTPAQQIDRNFAEVESTIEKTFGAVYGDGWVTEDRMGGESVNMAALVTNLFNATIKTLIPTAARTTASESYVSWPVDDEVTVSLTKRTDTSRLVVFYTGTAMDIGSSGMRTEIAVLINDVDYRVARFFHSNYGWTEGTHDTITGIAIIEDIPAGDTTLTLRARIDRNTGLLLANTDDSNTLLVVELP